MDINKLAKGIGNIPLQNAIEVSASTLEEALKQGADNLKTSIINLDYEVVQRGKKGFFGLGKQDFTIRVWKTGELDLSQMSLNPQEEYDDASYNPVDLNLPRDGECRIKIKKAGIYIRVNAPKNGGKAIDLKEVENTLYRRGVHHFNKNQIKKIAKDATGEWNKIGEWLPNPEYDSRITVNISTDEMEAFVNMSAPIYSGRTLEPEEIINTLEAEGIKFGVLYDKIKEISEEEIVNASILVAKGQPPKTGEDSFVSYRFRTGLEGGPVFDKGQEVVDFRNLNRVENVVSGQVLAEKTPATTGKHGRTVTNKILEAKDGKDLPFKIGENIRLSDDGKIAYAECDGQVFLAGQELNVRKVFEVKGDVDYNIGNIEFVGSVLVQGNVKENFRIKAAGNIEIKGMAHRAELIAEGKITCKGGINGGKIKSEKGIYSNYINNAEVYSGFDVVSKEEIINSKVVASGRVICLTGKGGIIGGDILAGFLIIAKKLGSDSYTATNLEAGVDPTVKMKIKSLEEQKRILTNKLEKLNLSLETLEKGSKEGKISPQKATLLKKMKAAQQQYNKKLSLLERNLTTMHQYILNLENKGSISARTMVYPGVKMRIKNAEYEVKNDYKAVTFKYGNGMIKPEKFEGIDMEELKKQQEQ